ncbi:epoxide hydrolase 3-like isoform X2 [Planococcus citri]|uniref:epoxide hydrolase 3-like isoform X2 n=1 Tax=Planococcus citri TaxID=170843 RepID=UPI0031F9DC8B
MSTMKSVQYNDSIVIIPHFESLKIFCFSFIWGMWTMAKRVVLQMLKSSSFEWNDIDNPPLCLVDTKLGQHNYMKIKGKGIKLHYVEAGDKNKPTLLLLHGFPDCWMSWFNQIPELSEHFRVIAIDLKGFGDSDKPLARRSYRLELLLEELTMFISSLGITRCSIIGHDLGALFGWYLVHLNPDLVSKFVAISCPHPNVYWDDIPRGSRFNKNWIELAQLPILPELDALKNDLEIITQCYGHLKSKKNYEGYIEAYKYTFNRREDWTGAINYFRNLPFYRLEGESLREIDVRCLLITGKVDESVPLESVVKSTEFIQKYYLKVIENAGHYPHQENPEKVNKALLEFLLDPPLMKNKKDVQSSGGIFGKMMGSVSNGFNYGSEVLSNIKNDPKAK